MAIEPLAHRHVTPDVLAAGSLARHLAEQSRALGGQPLARRARDHLLRARAGGHALGGDTYQPAGTGVRGDRRPEQRVDLLRGDAAHGRRLVLRVARLDVDLGAQALLALADEL